MNIEITSNALKAAVDLDATGRKVLTAANKAHRAASRVLFDEDRRQVNVIYARPIPRSGMRSKKTGKMLKRGTGKPRWKRKGTLRRGENLAFTNPLESLIANVNDTPYAVARHELNKPGADGVTRHDPWRRKTVEKAGPAAAAEFERVFESEMNK